MKYVEKLEELIAKKQRIATLIKEDGKNNVRFSRTMINHLSALEYEVEKEIKSLEV